MGDTLFGRERSGTPLETRGATKKLGGAYESLFSGDANPLMQALMPFQRMGSQAFTNIYGYDPSDIGGVLESLLADPASQTEGLFSAMQPFEARETERQAAGLRNVYGSQGARFSRNMAGGESLLRGELSNQFARARQEALLGANQQRMGALQSLIAMMGQQQQNMFMPLQLANQFLQPGAPIMQEGMLPGLIGLAGNLYLGRMLGNRGGGVDRNRQYTPEY